MFRKDVPARVVITEYVDVAHGFYDEDEPGLVNAVLDAIARDVARQAKLEQERIGEPRPGDAGEGALSDRLAMPRVPPRTT